MHVFPNDPEKKSWMSGNSVICHFVWTSTLSNWHGIWCEQDCSTGKTRLLPIYRKPILQKEHRTGYNLSRWTTVGQRICQVVFWDAPYQRMNARSTWLIYAIDKIAFIWSLTTTGRKDPPKVQLPSLQSFCLLTFLRIVNGLVFGSPAAYWPKPQSFGLGKE